MRRESSSYGIVQMMSYHIYLNHRKLFNAHRNVIIDSLKVNRDRKTFQNIFVDSNTRCTADAVQHTLQSDGRFVIRIAAILLQCNTFRQRLRRILESDCSRYTWRKFLRFALTGFRRPSRKIIIRPAEQRNDET